MKDSDHTYEWVALNFNQILTLRQTKFQAVRANKKKVGFNAFSNIIFVFNHKIPLSWFAMTFETFKNHCKKELL